jgi:NADH/NAD ratio-sensing transcriptional regulator Rex
VSAPGANRIVIYRLLVILDALRARHCERPVNCQSLGDLLEVSAKTIQRDLEFLRDFMAVPIEYDPVVRGFKLAGEVTGGFFDIARTATLKWKEAA